MMIKYFLLLSLLSFFSTTCIAAASSDNFDDDFEPFIDSPVRPEIIYPDWFKESFLDLQDDIQESLTDKKKGIIVYFGQKHCAYCQALMEKDFGQKDIATYVRNNFDVIAINIWGSKEVTTPDGKVMTEREYALREKANLTPSLIFYNTQGEKAFMLRGYYPPYKFRAALEYVAEKYYQEESFSDYITRADPPPKFEISDMNKEDFFMSPPYVLDRSHFKADKPLLVFFEQHDCHACDVLHSDPIQYPKTQNLLTYFDSVQVDINSNTPILTPDGKKLTAKQWANQLNLFYTPTIIAFDESGKEIMRIDSVAHVYRLNSILEFIASKTYLTTENFMSWRFDVIFGGKKLPDL
ncbi:MAG: thioredoxin fold domain-containing protein [Pseudomonadota bacterium]